MSRTWAQAIENPGTYQLADGKQKTAFGRGTLFFRHGAKSEPAQYEDLVLAVNHVVERRRKLWFKGIRRVIEAEPGDTIQVVQAARYRDGAAVAWTDRRR